MDAHVTTLEGADVPVLALPPPGGSSKPVSPESLSLPVGLTGPCSLASPLTRATERLRSGDTQRSPNYFFDAHLCLSVLDVTVAFPSKFTFLTCEVKQYDKQRSLIACMSTNYSPFPPSCQVLIFCIIFSVFLLSKHTHL